MKLNEFFNYFNDQLKKYCTLDRFGPVEKLVYGFAGLIFVAVVVALIKLVIK